MTTRAPDAIDQHSVDQCIRLVVYGPSTGGKTTTARALGRILASPVVDATEDDLSRTLDFDWLEFEGGTRNGSPVKVQLITVPGHDPLRRVELLKVADVVLFVADTTEERLDQSVDLFAELVEEIERFELDPSVVVQANKRDYPSALPMETVRRRLDLGPEDRVIETVATTGEGVRMAFVFAMRHGIERLDRRNEDGQATDPEQLKAMLAAVDRRAPVEGAEGPAPQPHAELETPSPQSLLPPEAPASPIRPRPAKKTGPADERSRRSDDEATATTNDQPPPPTGSPSPISERTRPSRWKQLLGR